MKGKHTHLDEEVIIRTNEEIIADELLKIQKGESKITEIPMEEEWAKPLIHELVKTDVSYFEKLLPEQRTEEDALLYVKYSLSHTDAQKNDEKLYFETMDRKSAFHFDYLSNDDEVLEYFDCELSLPTWLRIKAAATFAVSNATKLLEKINVTLGQFSIQLVYAALRRNLTDIFRRELLKYIEEKEIGYFHFEPSYHIFTDIIKSNLDAICEEYGLALCDFHLMKMTISETALENIQNEYLNARILGTRAEAEILWAEASLEILKKKSEILQAHQMPMDTLTEMEKDKALERHLKKINNRMEHQEEMDEPNGDGGITFQPKLIMERPKKPKKPDDYYAVKLWKIILSGILAVIAAVAPFIAKSILADVEVAKDLDPLLYSIPCFVVGAILLIVTVSLILKKIFERDKVKEYKDAEKKYKDEDAIYKNKEKEYENKKESLKADGKAFFENHNGIYEAK